MLVGGGRAQGSLGALRDLTLTCRFHFSYSGRGSKNYADNTRNWCVEGKLSWFQAEWRRDPVSRAITKINDLPTRAVENNTLDTFRNILDEQLVSSTRLTLFTLPQLKSSRAFLPKSAICISALFPLSSVSDPFCHHR